MKVSELLMDDSKWCQGAYAIDAKGNAVGEDSDDVCRWCLMGAIYKCYCYWSTSGIQQDIHDIAKKMASIIGNYSFIEWNDDPKRTFAEVREAILKADI